MTSKEVLWPNLVSEIIDLNKADIDGWTSFMFACKYGQLYAVKSLGFGVLSNFILSLKEITKRSLNDRLDDLAIDNSLSFS